MEHRLYRRRSIAISFRVYDDETGQFIGRIGDISKGGLLVYGPSGLPVDRLYRLRIDLPDDHGNPRSVKLIAKSMWSGRDTNPELFSTGFRLFELEKPDNSAALQALLSRFTVAFDEDDDH